MGQRPIYSLLCTAQSTDPPEPENQPMADAQTRPSFFDFDVTKMMGDFRFHPFDVETVMAYQRRNIALLATKAGTEAADVLRKRACEGLDELRDFTKQQGAH